MSKTYTSKTKVDIVLESIKKDNVVQVAREHGVSHGMLSNWKKQFIDNTPQVFESTTYKEAVSLNNKIKDASRTHTRDKWFLESYGNALRYEERAWYELYPIPYTQGCGASNYA